MAEVCDLDNEPLVKMVGAQHVQTVVSHDIIGRLMIQCARQHGLASVWQKIMGFEGGAASSICCSFSGSPWASKGIYCYLACLHVHPRIALHPPQRLQGPFID